MEFKSTLNYFRDNETFSPTNFTYRTEMYLQQREKQTSSTTITTWKNLKNQKRIFDNDQEELDRVISTIDSIHGTFNRSLLKPFNQVYSSLYGDDDQSTRLMETFCQRQDHFLNYDYDSTTQDLTTSSIENFQDTDFENDTDNEEEKENEKKKSYDSGYGSVIPKRQFSREPFLLMAQPLNIK